MISDGQGRKDRESIKVHTEAPSSFILRQAEKTRRPGGMPHGGFSEATCYNWHKTYAGLARRLTE